MAAGAETGVSAHSDDNHLEAAGALAQGPDVEPLHEQPPHHRTRRHKVYLQLEPSARRGHGLSVTNRVLIVLIVIATLIAVLETEPTLGHYRSSFVLAEFLLGIVFIAEYVARIWVAPERHPHMKPWRARLKYARSPAAIADLLAVIACLAPAAGEGVLLRVVRLLRILRLAKLGRMSRAFGYVLEAFQSRREELLISLITGVGLMLVSASLLYFVEGHVQPEAFGSIPRALWWAVATLTTIGYGDVYPITPLGKLLAGITAITSIGVVAMPTGILAAAFSAAMRKNRHRDH